MLDHERLRRERLARERARRPVSLFKLIRSGLTLLMGTVAMVWAILVAVGLSGPWDLRQLTVGLLLALAIILWAND